MKPSRSSANTSRRRYSGAMQKITPFLWYDNNAEDAAKFYTSIFKNSKTEKSRVTEMQDRARRAR